MWDPVLQWKLWCTISWITLPRTSWKRMWESKYCTGLHCVVMKKSFRIFIFHTWISESKSTYQMHKCLDGRREVSHQQVMSHFISQGNYYSSHAFRTIWLYEFLNLYLAWRPLRWTCQSLDIKSASGYDLDDNGSDLHSIELSIKTSSDRLTFCSDAYDYCDWLTDDDFQHLT